ncbi:MliC family protein [Paracoccus pacificus]|uniref:MliC family protein n=1 Tax=Paracoccus pacificus TaxID=1463598 RepID=A0ABW4R718_9RHOB
MRILVAALMMTVPAAAMAQDAMSTVTFTCEGDNTFQASFINAGDDSFAVVYQDDTLIPMTIAESASGARYLSADGALELWTKGSEATLSRLGDKEEVIYKGCTAPEEGNAG